MGKIFLATCRDPLRRDRRHRGERVSLARRAELTEDTELGKVQPTRIVDSI